MYFSVHHSFPLRCSKKTDKAETKGRIPLASLSLESIILLNPFPAYRCISSFYVCWFELGGADAELLHILYAGRHVGLAVGCATGNWTARFNFAIAAYSCNVRNMSQFVIKFKAVVPCGPRVQNDLKISTWKNKEVWVRPGLEGEAIPHAAPFAYLIKWRYCASSSCEGRALGFWTRDPCYMPLESFMAPLWIFFSCGVS